MIFKKIVRKIKSLIHGNFNIPIGDDYFGKKAFLYEQTRQDSLFWKNEQNFVAKTLKELNSSSEINTLLDLPSGTGRFYELYEALGIRYIGGDSSFDMLKEAKKRMHISSIGKQHRMFSTEIDLPNNSVDIIVCIRFLQWIISLKDVKKTLDEFYRVSNKYCILEFCVGKIATNIETLSEDLTLWDKLNYENLEQLLKTHGFKIIKTKFIGNDPENPNLTGFLCKKIL